MNVPLRNFSFCSALLILFLLSFTREVNAQVVSVHQYNILMNTPLQDGIFGLSAAVASTPANGTAVIVGGTPNTLTYTPDADFTGVDTFKVSYIQIGPGITTYLRTYIVTVSPAYTFARQDYATTLSNQSVTIDVLSNDSTTFGNLLISDIALTNFGTAVIAGDQIIFTPDPGFYGMAHFDYIACNDVYACDLTTVSINVFEVPLPEYDTTQLITSKNTPIIFILPAGFHTDALPANGSVNPLTDEAFQYSPNANYSGFETFTFSQFVNGYTAHHIVKVHVLNTPSPNQYAKNDFVYTPLNTPITINVLQNDLGYLDVDVIGTVSEGFVVLNNDNTVTYTPDASYSGGVPTFTYHVVKAPGIPGPTISETATVYVAVSDLNPAQSLYHLTTPADIPLVINYSIPFTNYSFTITNQADAGVVNYYPGNSSVVINGQTVSGYNLLVYTPGIGTTYDEFEVLYCINGNCKNVKIEVDVIPVNNPDNPACIEDCVWAGDLDHDGKVDINDILPLGMCMGEVGEARYNPILQWYGQYAPDWENIVPSPFNIKHIDGDGDGTIQALDTATISQFYGYSHSITPEPVNFNLGLPVYFSDPNSGTVYQPGDMVVLDVIYGTPVKPAVNAYGLTFSLDYNAGIIEAGSFNVDYTSNSWMSQTSATLGLYKEPMPGKLDFGVTRTGGVGASGYGKIGEMNFIVIDVVDGLRLDRPVIQLAFNQATGMDASGICGIVNGEMIELPLDLSGAVKPLEQQMVVFPNPATEHIILHLNANGDNEFTEVRIYNMMGQVMSQQNQLSGDHLNINTSDLVPGIYLVEAMTSNGKITKKFEIMK